MERRLAVWTLVAAGLISGRAEAQGFSIGAGAGRVDPDGTRAALWVTSNLRWELARNVVIEPEVGYWKRTETSAGGESSVEDLSAGFNILRRFPGKTVSFFAGAGAGVHLVKSSFGIPGTISASDRELKQGLHLLAGFDYKVGGGLYLFGLVRHDAVADIGQSKAYGGLRFNI